MTKNPKSKTMSNFFFSHLISQPPVRPPAPVCLHRVDHPRDQNGEDDVPVVVRPLGDGAGDDGGASGSECALKNNIFFLFVGNLLKKILTKGKTILWNIIRQR